MNKKEDQRQREVGKDNHSESDCYGYSLVLYKQCQTSIGSSIASDATTPSILSQYSTTGIPAYAKATEVLRLLNSNTINILLECEREFSRNRAMDQVSFRQEFPASKVVLRHIFTFSKNFTFSHLDFIWNGIGADLMSIDLILINTCTIQAVGITLHTMENRPHLHQDYGIGKFQVHITMWATQAIILKPHKFRRRGRPWVKDMFGLSDDANKQAANAEIVRQAITVGWFIRNPIIPLNILLCFFFAEHCGITWQSQKAAIDLPAVLEDNGHSDFRLRLWSDYTLRSIIPLGFMIVSVVLHMISTPLSIFCRPVIFFMSGKLGLGSGLDSQLGIVHIVYCTRSIAKRRGILVRSCATCWSDCTSFSSLLLTSCLCSTGGKRRVERSIFTILIWSHYLMN